MDLMKTSAALITAFSFSQAASASCAFVPGHSQSTLNFTLPSSISIPRDTPNGTIIYSAEKKETLTNQFKCSTSFYSGSLDGRGQKNSAGVYPVGDSGISWQWIYNGTPKKQYPADFFNAGNWGFFSTALGFNLIKTGDIKAGATIPSGILGYFTADTLKVINITITSTNVIAQSCETPSSIKVNLGEPSLSDFQPSEYNYWSTISIPLRNCPKGINKVQYSLLTTADSPAIYPSQGVIRLNSTSTAEGFAIKIKHPDTSEFNLTKKHEVSHFVSGQTVIYIELRAKYTKIPGVKDSELKPGTANAEIMYAIEYL